MDGGELIRVGFERIFEIHARAKRWPVAGDEDRADRAVDVGAVEGVNLGQLQAKIDIQRIALFRTIEGNLGGRATLPE